MLEPTTVLQVHLHTGRAPGMAANRRKKPVFRPRLRICPGVIPIQARPLSAVLALWIDFSYKDVIPSMQIAMACTLLRICNNWTLTAVSRSRRAFHSGIWDELLYFSTVPLSSRFVSRIMGPDSLVFRPSLGYRDLVENIADHG